MKSLFLVFLLFPSFIQSQNIIVDESYLDNSFWEFKSKLAICVFDKDAAVLKTLLSPKVQDCWDGYGYAGDEGYPLESFVRDYFSNKNSQEWNTLGNIIKYGFRREFDTIQYYQHVEYPRGKYYFRAPSYEENIRAAAYNGEEKIVILGEQIIVRDKPTLSANIIDRVSYGMYNYQAEETGCVHVTYSKYYNTAWVKIKLSNNEWGYVQHKYTSHFIDRSLVVAKIEGEWKIIVYMCHLDI